MDKLPCIEDHCLKYPVCKQKEEIYCTLLFTFFRMLLKENHVYNLSDDEMETFRKLFPKLENIKPSQELNEVYTGEVL